ncbi:lysylphosphatidylglycerol synthase domain-containing protein [Nonomuraea sp. bgisy101]|uniref:lysylphosphatidylglycerol synthase domain-containing protein n=1 Tax=Nonomuraea sp. bgisy101 TaxID=3413784 RepID=UPI003D70C4F3
MRHVMFKALRRAVGVVVLGVSVWYLAGVVSGPSLAAAARALLADPLGLSFAILLYGAAFALRSWAWTRVLRGLPFWHSWAAIHVSLLGNHVLPFRLGEALRVTSVLRRTGLAPAKVIASAVGARSADLLAVVLLALAAAPALVSSLAGWWVWPVAAVLASAAVAGFVITARHRGSPQGSAAPPGPSQRDSRGGRGRPWLRALAVFGCAALAWVLEAAIVYEVARLAGADLTAADAVAVTAVTIAAQTVAITPGGFGSYEAAATAAMVALGVPGGTAFAIALLTHAVKTAYSLAVGGVALVAPAPGHFGRLRLPRHLPPRPAPRAVPESAPVVAFIPVFNEEATIGEVVRRLPTRVAGRRIVTLVIDDGSTDASAARAKEAGARVLPQPRNLGLGAAVRRGLAEAARLEPAAAVYLDADLEYFPEDLESLAAPILNGEADYVVGSRFAGTIERMLPHRRFGNRLLTVWMRRLTRRRDLTDGQSGYRAFSLAALESAEVIHDYNYAQVLTLDLLAKGFVYREVPIRYAFRQSGESFVKLGKYLRKVIPAVHRELNT